MLRAWYLPVLDSKGERCLSDIVDNCTLTARGDSLIPPKTFCTLRALQYGRQRPLVIGRRRRLSRAWIAVTGAAGLATLAQSCLSQRHLQCDSPLEWEYDRSALAKVTHRGIHTSPRPMSRDSYTSNEPDPQLEQTGQQKPPPQTRAEEKQQKRLDVSYFTNETYNM